jgi:hypothetical protein
MKENYKQGTNQLLEWEDSDDSYQLCRSRYHHYPLHYKYSIESPPLLSIPRIWLTYCSIGFNIYDRYKAILKFLTDRSLQKEALWIQKRISSLQLNELQ